MTNTTKFPSPMGIFFVSIKHGDEYKLNISEFPSPLGIFFISIRH